MDEPDILIVDDTPSSLMAIEASLAGLARRIVKASSGTEALAILQDQDFALIFLDVQMPRMDGFEVARRIRDTQQAKHIPIVFMTAFDRDDRAMLSAYRLGAVDFLFKPLVPDVLRAKASVFVTLQKRAAEIERQSVLLRDHEQREHERLRREEHDRIEGEFLRQRMEELREADRRKDEFLAMLGHELRTPLAPIVTGLEVMRRKLVEQGPVPDGVDRTRIIMERQVRHMTRLVDDLLDISRINCGKIELRLSRLSLQEVVDHAVHAARPIIEERGHGFTVELPPEPLMLDADLVRLSQVLANLLTNAAKYTDAGGHVRLVATSDGEEVTLRVLDDGRGIASHMLPTVFDMFVQEKDGSEGGLGLGLALVKRLAEMHRGRVSAASPGRGQGSEFRVILPLAAVSHPPFAPSVDSMSETTRGLRIAIVEDHPDVREMLEELLSLLDHHVEVAATGAAGAELIARSLPDIALVDIGLPDIDGYQVAQRVRAHDAARSVVLVALTGYGRDQDRARALKAGFDAHITKPVTREALQRILARTQAQQDAAAAIAS